MVDHNLLMFRAQRDAGGGFAVRVEAGVPYDKLWLVGNRGEIMAKVTIPSWKETEEIAKLLAETISFVNKKCRRFITEIWVNTNAHEDLNLALEVFAEPETERKNVGIVRSAVDYLPDSAG